MGSTRKCLFEVSRSTYNMFCEFIWESMVVGEGSYRKSQDMKKALKEEDEEEEEEEEEKIFSIPSSFVTNVLDSYIHHEVPCFPYYTEDEFNELCVCFLVRFSTKTWMVENKTKLIDG